MSSSTQVATVSGAPRPVNPSVNVGQTTTIQNPGVVSWVHFSDLLRRDCWGAMPLVALVMVDMVDTAKVMVVQKALHHCLLVLLIFNLVQVDE